MEICVRYQIVESGDYVTEFKKQNVIRAVQK